MKVITCTGYTGTGSSAVTDLLSEYDCVYKNTDYEISLIYGYKGINYLYYNLVENPDYHISNLALKDFIDHCHYLATNGTTMNYEIYFKGNFLKFTEQYVSRIGGKNFSLKMLDEVEDKSRIYQIFFRILNKIYHSIIHTDNVISALKVRPYYFHILDKETFVFETKEYIRNLISCFAKEGMDAVVIDQIAPNSHIDNTTRYFDDIRVIVVDRDPRDVYLNQKYIWKTSYIPDKDIQLFCQWYRWIRSFSIEDDKKYLHLRFEDLLYKYEESVRRIENYCDLDPQKHIASKSRFDPERSKRNSRLWEKYPEEVENIKLIEKNLREYLYNE